VIAPPQNAESLSLCWYRNQLVHFFVSEALIAIAFASLWKYSSAAASAAASSASSSSADGAAAPASAASSSGVSGGGAQWFEQPQTIEAHAGAYTFTSVSEGLRVPAVLSVPRDALLRSVRLVSQLLKREFIFTPAPDIEANFNEAIESLVRRGVLSADGQNVCIEPGGREVFVFLCMLLWPFIEVGRQTSSLYRLRPAAPHQFCVSSAPRVCGLPSS
jgi:hypothetical protein